MSGRALIVEDEVLVAMYVEDCLMELGYEVACTATTLSQGLSCAQSQAIDIAVLDVNLAGQMSFPIAEALQERRIPFLFASGYSSAGFPDAFASAVRIRKPFRVEDLAAALERVRGR